MKNNDVLPLTLRRKLALELWRLRENNIRREHPLRQLFWECTLRCNLHCRHCGSDCKVKSDQPDMPKEDFFGVLDSVARRVNPSQVLIVVTGGEPLMRDDLEDCGLEMQRRGFPWGMVCNGQLLTRERLDGLLCAGLCSIAVSLDGLEADHNWMRGNSQSFQMVSRAIDMLVATPHLAFDVVTCVNRRNYAKLGQLRQFLIDKGVGRWRLFSVFPVGRASNDAFMQLTDEEFQGMFRFIRQTRQEGRIMADYGCEGFLGNYEGDVRTRFFSCHAGITVGSVMADGTIAACASIRADYGQGNIYKGDDFMEVWENKYLPYRDRRWMRRGECASCKYWRYCQGNGMHLRDEEGNLLFCHLGKLTRQSDESTTNRA